MKRKNTPKKRIDILLVEKGLADSREKAQALIMAGAVIVDEKKIEKPGHKVNVQGSVRIRKKESQEYVSRAGVKLEHAVSHFGISVNGKICIDIGSSTGGFTEVLLKRQARKVLAIDVGKNQMHWSIRNNEKVKLIEGYNARYLNEGDLIEWGFEESELVVIDVSFISSRLIFSALKEALRRRFDVISLVKPQFEAGREHVSRGGIVKDPMVRENTVRKLISDVESLGFRCAGLTESPIKGADGNVEYLAHWIRD